MCPRKWAFRYIDDIQTPPHPSAAKGSRVHKAAETYLQSAFIDLTTEEGQILLPGLQYLPPPLYPGMQLESSFGIQIADTKIRGIRDVWLPGECTVIDHKTTGALHWAKTVADLLNDTQAITYAVAAMQETGAEQANLRWVYYSTKRPYQARPVDVTVTREQTEPVCKRINETGKLIKLARQLAPQAERGALDYPHNPDACDAYGGCPYLSRCNLVQGRMSFLDELDKKLSEPGPAPLPPPEQMGLWTPPPVTFPVPVPASEEGPQSASEAAATVQQWTEQPTPGGPVPTKKRGKAKAPAVEAFTLYVDCAPLAGTTEDFINRAPRIYDMVKQGAQPIDAIEHDLVKHPPTGNLIVMTGSKLVSDALPILQAKAQLTVRAFR